MLVALVCCIATVDIRITRAIADANFLFPANAKRLTRFMMQATYGDVRPMSSAWMQRGVLDAAADSDFNARLSYYEEARRNGAPRGSILMAERDDGTICGFADVGASLWLPSDKAFRLPQSPELQRLAETGIGADGQSKPSVALRPYVSNLVVTPDLRRAGIGRQLMEACEDEAATWLAACAPCEDIWLEVTSTNKVALDFYATLGYESVAGSTAGNEVQREGESFDMVAVQRTVMRKPLSSVVSRLRGGSSIGLRRAIMSRRQLVWASSWAIVGSLNPPRAVEAFPPPVGEVERLLPLLQAREIIVERRAAVRKAAAASSEAGSATAFDWAALQQVLLQPPITAAPAKGKAATLVVGSGLRAASEAYDASLRYTAEIDEADRSFCYVSKAVKVDEQCLQRLYTSDRTYRTLLRNAVLQALQDLEGEAGYLAICARATSDQPSSVASKRDGLVCGALSEDFSEIERLFENAQASFDKLFGSVGPAEMRAGMERLKATPTQRG